MSSDSRAAEAARLGNIREAIECLFEESGVDPARRPTYFADRISAWTDGAALGGTLATDRRLRDAVLEVYRHARVDVPDSVHRLCSSPEGAVGLAVFPVVVMDGRKYTGALRAIEISVEAREARHPVEDDDFVRAVEHARRIAVARCGGEAKTRVREARWRILPDLASNADLGDGSVALAAFVAFISFALGASVPASLAFSGVLNGRSFVSPPPATFDEKRRALRERAAITMLFWPEWLGGSDDLVDREARIERLLARVFEQPWDDLAHRLLSTQGPAVGMARWMPLFGGLATVAGGAWWIHTRSSDPEVRGATIDGTTEIAPSRAASTGRSQLPAPEAAAVSGTSGSAPLLVSPTSAAERPAAVPAPPAPANVAAVSAPRGLRASPPTSVRGSEAIATSTSTTCHPSDVDECKRQCDLDDAASCYNAARYVLNNLSNASAAAAFFKRACDGNYLKGCTDLGFMHERGRGVPKDSIRAAGLYQRACDQGEPHACNNLGGLYGNGAGVAQDRARAATLFGRACDAGNSQGCGNLGLAYRDGVGVEPDKVRATELLKRACQADAAWCRDYGEVKAK